MSGNIGEKALSVFLSTIMVLSVVAIGAAGFAGSAAAQDEPINGSEAVFVASTANSGDTSASHTHVIRINVSDALASGNTDLSAGNANITIDYDQDVGLTSGSPSFDDVGSTGAGTDIDDDDFVRIYTSGTEFQTGTDNNNDVVAGGTDNSR